MWYDKIKLFDQSEKYLSSFGAELSALLRPLRVRIKTSLVRSKKKGGEKLNHHYLICYYNFINWVAKNLQNTKEIKAKKLTF